MFQNSDSKQIQRQYQGYLSTPLLWTGFDVLNLKQLELPVINTNIFENEVVTDNLLLGMRVERFVMSELNQHKNITILAENVQIQNEKITIGEIDCLLKQDNTFIHLEIIYKFYLYDCSVGDSEIEHWIGPNRNDSLVKKLIKLKDKQLPLIYAEKAEPLLKSLNILKEKLKQYVYFKAQLFTPYEEDSVPFKHLNKDCVKGFYIHVSKINEFNDCKFYIPTKSNWLIDIQLTVNWISFEAFTSKITALTTQKKSPLCWIKHPNGMTQKFFVIWW